MHLTRWMWTGLASTLACGCNTGLVIGDVTGDGGTSMPVGSGGSGGSSITSNTSGGGDVTPTTTTTSGSGGGAGSGMGGGDAGPSPLNCPVWADDRAFSMLRLDDTALGRVYDVWGLSDDDYYVALGVETASWPTTSSLAAVAHFDHGSWTLDWLPASVDVAGLTGVFPPDTQPFQTEVWALASPGASQGPVIFRNANAAHDNMWTSETLAQLRPFDVVALGDTDGLLSVSSSAVNYADGEVYRRTGGQWVRMTMPDLGVVYALTKLRRQDDTHVYAVGYSGGADVGSNVLAAFDGTQWRAHRVPAECGDLSDVTGVAPDRIYTAGTVFTGSRRVVCRVSPDLTQWNVLDALSFNGDKPTIVATAGGTVITIVGNYMARGFSSMVRMFRNDTPSATCPSTQLGHFVAWSAPGSANVHVFSGEQAGVTMAGAKHLVARIDP